MGMTNKVIQLKDGSDNLYPVPPNDYIVEQGTSGIWTYRKWNSGIAECWGIVTQSVSSWNSWGSVYEGTPSTQANFPSGLFFSAPHIWITCEAGIGIMSIETQGFPTKTQTPTFFVLRPNNSGMTGNFNINVYAIGTWK